MLYLIGLGLNEKGFSWEAYQAIEEADKVYLEEYTVEFPYKKEDLEKEINKKIGSADRDFVESLNIVSESKKQDVALLVYGSPLMATTHITLIEECKKQKIKFRVIHAGSVFDAVGETGLQLYKFGKIASLPKHEADSFMEIVKDNQKINAHSLILIDIGLELNLALEKLEKAAEKHKVKLGKIIICSRLGSDNSKIYYDNLKNLKGKKVKAPFCIIIPGKLHFVEEEFLDKL
jgi:diphthine synthase